MTRDDLAWDVGTVALAVAAAVLATLGGPLPLRAAVLGLFLVAAPGFAVTRAVGLATGLVALVVSLGLSLSVAATAAAAQLYAQRWDPALTVRLLAAATVALALVSLAVRSSRTQEVGADVPPVERSWDGRP